MIVCVFFFFKQKTAYELRISDWSSDVCSSDLAVEAPEVAEELQADEDHEKAGDEGKAALRQEQGLVGARTGRQSRTQRSGKGAEEHVGGDPADVARKSVV